MNRRRFVGALLALPLIARAIRETDRPFIVHRIDGTEPKRVVLHGYCPQGHIYVAAETAFMAIADRPSDEPNAEWSPNQDGVSFACWT